MTINVVRIERTTAQFECDYLLCKGNKISYDSSVNIEFSDWSDFLEKNGWYHDWHSIDEKVYCPKCRDDATFNFAESIGL